MKLRGLTRIIKEDYSAENQELVGKLALSLNPFLEQLNQIMNKNIDYDNLNRELISIDVSVDSSGIPVNNLEIKHSLKTRPKGILCVSARNLTDNTPISNAPFIQYSFFGDTTSVIKINYITGLPINKKWNLMLEVIG